MKKIYLMLLLTTIVSCSDDTNTPDIPLTASTLRRTGAYPENADNPYDDAGITLNDITDSYLTNVNNATTTSGKISEIEGIAFSNADFLALNTKTYTSPDASRVDTIANGGINAAHQIISNAPLSIRGALSLSSFVDSLFDMKARESSYDDMYAYIMDYEAGVIAEPGYTAVDKKIILTTSSVARHGFYYASKKKKRPRDRDWDISWGNIVAGTEGSEESTAKGIVMAAATGAVINR
ncbi:MAG: hypothetical protein EOO51_14900 [Flavobacterium sp.]|nr:MAG: hypothetical protein EOO51_14900 [Flavobacterium sp.]